MKIIKKNPILFLANEFAIDSIIYMVLVHY